MHEYSLGIDTSNYKTSAALTDRYGSIVCDERRLLTVKKGERGLRQQEALFQHINALPEVLLPLLETARGGRIVSVAASYAPRRKKGSYMPVFTAGVSQAKTIAALTGVDPVFFSHQEGHIAAAMRGTRLEGSDSFLAFHFSGGTTEGVAVMGEKCETVAGTKDIAYGQVLDRAGVLMGMEFPCGERLDAAAQAYIARRGIPKGNVLPAIRTEDGFINLSGLETAFAKELVKGDTDEDILIVYLFMRISESIAAMTEAASAKSGLTDVLYAGGVSASRTLRLLLPRISKGVGCCFGQTELSSDNAVGIALLGGEKVWK